MTPVTVSPIRRTGTTAICAHIHLTGKNEQPAGVTDKPGFNLRIATIAKRRKNKIKERVEKKPDPA